METNICADGCDEMKVQLGWVQMEVKRTMTGGVDIISAGTVGNGCNFCPRASL